MREISTSELIAPVRREKNLELPRRSKVQTDERLRPTKSADDGPVTVTEAVCGEIVGRNARNSTTPTQLDSSLKLATNPLL